MKKILLAICLLLTTFAFAQNDKKATNLIDAVSNKLQSMQPIVVDFTCKISSPSSAEDKSYSGTLYSMENMYKLSMSDQVIYCNGDNIWTYFEDVNEVEISEFDDSSQSLMPFDIIKNYKNDYKARFIGEQGNTATVELYPTKKNSFFIKANLVVDVPKKLVKTITLSDRDGNIFVYMIKSIKTDNKLSKKHFTFQSSDYPGVEVIDMR